MTWALTQFYIFALKCNFIGNWPCSVSHAPLPTCFILPKANEAKNQNINIYTNPWRNKNYWLNTGAPILQHHDEISRAGGASWHSSSCSHSVQKEQLSRKSQLIIGISWCTNMCTNMCTNTVQLAFTFIFIFSIEPIYDTLRWSNICASVRKWQLQELSRISRELWGILRP